MRDYLATQASWWAHNFNVEAVWCEELSFEDVCADSHRVVALGNDGMGVVMLVDNQRVQAVHGLDADLVGLAYLGRQLMNLRKQETLGQLAR